MWAFWQTNNLRRRPLHRCHQNNFGSEPTQSISGETASDRFAGHVVFLSPLQCVGFPARSNWLCDRQWIYVSAQLNRGKTCWFGQRGCWRSMKQQIKHQSITGYFLSNCAWFYKMSSVGIDLWNCRRSNHYGGIPSDLWSLFVAFFYFCSQLCNIPNLCWSLYNSPEGLWERIPFPNLPPQLYNAILGGEVRIGCRKQSRDKHFVDYLHNPCPFQFRSESPTRI